MISTDPLLLNEMELKLAAKHYEKQSTLKQVIQKLNIILGYFKLEVRVSTSLSWLQSPGTGWTWREGSTADQKTHEMEKKKKRQKKKKEKRQEECAFKVQNFPCIYSRNTKELLNEL